MTRLFNFVSICILTKLQYNTIHLIVQYNTLYCTKQYNVFALQYNRLHAYIFNTTHFLGLKYIFFFCPWTWVVVTCDWQLLTTVCLWCCRASRHLDYWCVCLCVYNYWAELQHVPTGCYCYCEQLHIRYIWSREHSIRVRVCARVCVGRGCIWMSI